MEHYSKKERVADVINVILMIILCALTVYPFLNALAYSLTPMLDSSSRIITIIPFNITLANYALCFNRNDVLGAALVSVGRTLAGIGGHLIVTGLAAYAMSIKDLPYRRALTIFMIIPMYLSAGLIPFYVLIHDLGLMNKFWVYVVPGLFATYNMLIMRTYFETIPDSLSESARIDGASDFTIFIRIIVPLSMPIVATISLFVGVGQWNSWFDAALFVNNVKLHPLSMLLRRILMENEITDVSSALAMSQAAREVSPQGIRMAILIITTLPIIFIYPFFQRYFLKGIMIGAVKG